MEITFPYDDNDTTYVPYTGAISDVNLGTHTLTTPIVYGDTASAGTLTLSSTSNATKGKILFGTSAYDEVNNRLGIGLNAPTATIHGSTPTNGTQTGDTILKLTGVNPSGTGNLTAYKYFASLQISSDTGLGIGSSGIMALTTTSYTSQIQIGGSSVSINNGNLLVGTTTNGTSKLSVLSTTEQLRLSYDVSNYATFTVGSTGILTVVPTIGRTIFNGTISADSSVQLANVGTATDARIGSYTTGKLGVFMGVTSGIPGIYAYNYSGGGAQNLIFNQFGGNVGIGTTTPGAVLENRANTALTNQATNSMILNHRTSGTAANGFGVAFAYELQSSTTYDRLAAQSIVSWVDVTDATRRASLIDYLTNASASNKAGLAQVLQSDQTSVFAGIGISSPSTWLHVLGTTEQLRLGYDATNYASFTTSSTGDLTIAPSGTSITVSKPIKLQSYTVATLPSGSVGMTAYVTDATAPTYLGTLTGGGTIVTPVFYNGTAWVSY